ncbi:MAG: lytic transglycosylase domain-containing protein [Actinomycetota bacterium]|nr:lytic transglycosylase domain-containing protein [Actinomycetota bacterium]
MPNRPTRPGKHVARHKAPSAFSRATQRFTPGLHGLGVRRTGGTAVALSAAVLAGAAGSATGGATPAEQPTAQKVAIDAPTSGSTTAGVEEHTPAEDRARVAAATGVSRSQARAPLSQAGAVRRDQATSDTGGSAASTSHTARAQSVVPEDPRAIAESMLDEYGWDSYEMECLDQLWVSESNWQVHATNPTSGAYGIPQALPAEKMASAGSDWRTNPATQIEWGLRYIDLSYGSPCSAWEFKQDNNWY